MSSKFKRFRQLSLREGSACLAPSKRGDRKSTRLNSSHLVISYAVFCLKKKKNYTHTYCFIQSKTYILILSMTRAHTLFIFFFFNDTATTEIYTLSLHDALPISIAGS